MSFLQFFQKYSLNITDVILSVMALTVAVVTITTISTLNSQAQGIHSFRSMAQESRVSFQNNTIVEQEIILLTDEEKNAAINLLDATGEEGHAHEVRLFLEYYGFDNISVQDLSEQEQTRTVIQVNNQFSDLADFLRDNLKPIYPDALIKKNILTESDTNDIVIVLGQSL